jgi:hypothetical protein
MDRACRPRGSPHHSRRQVSRDCGEFRFGAWTFSTMRLRLFFDGRYPRYALPVLAEYSVARLLVAPNHRSGFATSGQAFAHSCHRWRTAHGPVACTCFRRHARESRRRISMAARSPGTPPPQNRTDGLRTSQARHPRAERKVSGRRRLGHRTDPPARGIGTTSGNRPAVIQSADPEFSETGKRPEG